MSEKTHIAWCDSTWNPWRGCDKVSPGCKNCYITSTTPFRVSGQKHGDPRVIASEAIWREPFKWNRKPWICEDCGTPSTQPRCGSDGCYCGSWRRRRVFSLSLGDWLDPNVPIEWLARMLDTIRQCPELDFLLATKRPELFESRMVEALEDWNTDEDAGIDWCETWLDGNPPPNVWVIASAENQAMANKRIPELLRIPAVVRGLSCEPLLGPIKFSERALARNWCGCGNCQYSETGFPCPTPLPRIDWVIVGGESGKGARACDIAWVKSLVEQCAAAKVPCFVKQLGARPVYNGVQVQQRHAKGGEPSEWLAELRVRQFPEGRVTES